MNFTIYYFDPDKVKTFKDLYLEEKITEANGFKPLDSNNNLQNLDFASIAFLQTDKRRTPAWVSFIGQNFTIDTIENVSNSVILLIQVTVYRKKHFFAVVAGQGFAYLNKARLKYDFGLKVVLNTIDPGKISVFDSKNFSANQKQSRITFAKGNPIQEFQFDENEELLSLMSGKPIDTSFAKRISGAVPLHLAAELAFKELGKKCLFLLKKYRSSDYKKTFPFVDKFKPIEDEDLIRDLEKQLKDYIAAKKTDKISINFPTIDDYDPTYTFEYRIGGETLPSDNFEIEQIYSLIDQDATDDFSVEYLKRFRIHTLSSGGDFVNSFELFDTITFEWSYKSSTYVLNNSHWYKIDKKYADQIEKEFTSINIISVPSYLPTMKPKEDEGSYNERLDGTKFCLYDKKLFADKAPSSTSKIEVCDAFHKTDKHLVCVKKYSGSATLSHLFAQGSVSLQLLADYDKYRKFFCKKTNEHFKTKEFKPDTLKISDYSIIYAIATHRSDSFNKFVPFFSKVNLLTHLRIIKTKGAKVSLYKIDIV